MAKANAKFMAPLTPSANLAAVVGNNPLPRTEIVKKMWDYIKKNGLQDKTNKRMINSDAKLAAVFEGKKQKRFHEISFYYLMKGEIPVEKLHDYSYDENDGGKMVHFEFKWIDINELDSIDMRPANLRDMLMMKEFKLEHSIRVED